MYAIDYSLRVHLWTVCVAFDAQWEVFAVLRGFIMVRCKEAAIISPGCEQVRPEKPNLIAFLRSLIAQPTHVGEGKYYYISYGIG